MFIKNKMRYLLNKDKKIRKLFKKNEYKSLIYKSIVFNLKLPINIRENIFSILLKYKKNNKILIHNRCVYSNRARFILTKYKVSRLVFKRLVVLKQIMGVYKKT